MFSAVDDLDGEAVCDLGIHPMGLGRVQSEETRRGAPTQTLRACLSTDLTSSPFSPDPEVIGDQLLFIRFIRDLNLKRGAVAGGVGTWAMACSGCPGGTGSPGWIVTH